jgi:hypothetical protein
MHRRTAGSCRADHRLTRLGNLTSRPVFALRESDCRRTSRTNSICAYIFSVDTPPAQDLPFTIDPSTDAKPTVLFLCTHNARRSQIALGFFTHLAGDYAVAWKLSHEMNLSRHQAMASATATKRAFENTASHTA